LVPGWYTPAVGYVVVIVVWCGDFVGLIHRPVAFVDLLLGF
jgi:hypothetical protein